MDADQIRKGVSHLLRGDVAPVANEIESRVEWAPQEVFERVTTETTPPWLTSAATHETVRVSEAAYTTLLEDPQLAIDPPTDLDGIEVPLVLPRRSSRVDIRSSAVESGEKTVTMDGPFSYPEVLWTAVPFSETDGPVSVAVEQTPSETVDLSRVVRLSRTSAPKRTQVGLPALIPSDPQPPIVLISIDALRHDHRSEMEPLLEALGDDAIVPSEPRTQGTWTPPSHGSMFTGVHPGDHGYVGWGKTDADKRPIDPELTTIAELLTARGYKCSGLASHSRVLPAFGFGRGFHRFHHDGMVYTDWITRDHDAQSSVNTVREWISRDTTHRDHSLFYFLHVYDPHDPYIPPTDRIDGRDLDLGASDRYRSQLGAERGDDWNYVDAFHDAYDIDADLLDTAKSWYAESVRYTAETVAQLIGHLKTAGLFEDALVIVTGDHGEEFGERGFYTHKSLYDGNIRPFMAIKPPADQAWDHRDAIDTIDILPTIAELVGAEIPAQCRGVPIQSAADSGPRITERIYPQWYNVAIETDEHKAVLTYESNYPDRPGPEIVESGPALTEYYRRADIRAGEHEAASVPQSVRESLRETAEAFALDSTGYSGTETAPRPTQETDEQLAYLGYK